MSVSVVIPNYNYARYVGEAIDSVLGQTSPPDEIVVVDNGSTDDSLNVLAAYGDRIRVVTQENRGQAGARNRGIAESTGDFVAFLDADDIWLPEKLERQMALIDAGGAGLVYCGLEAVGPDLEPLGQLVEPRYRGRVVDAFLTRPGVAVVVGGESTAIVRRSVLDDVGRFDPELSISAGWDLWRRIATRYEVDYVPAPLVQYRQHGSGAHERLAAYWRDAGRASEKMLADPQVGADEAARRRLRRGFAVVAAKSHMRARQPSPALAWLARCVRAAPLA